VHDDDVLFGRLGGCSSCGSNHPYTLITTITLTTLITLITLDGDVLFGHLYAVEVVGSGSGSGRLCGRGSGSGRITSGGASIAVVCPK
jgi:hypothetical protein